MIFGFERDFAGTMRCIPMIVRFNLDQCGIKLSLKQWSRLGRDKRVELARQLCTTIDEIQAYRENLAILIESQPGQKVDYLNVEPDVSWENENKVPEQVLIFASGRHLPGVEWSRWSQLTRLQRFAIYKLTRASHDNDNFEPALSEFGLIK